MEWHRKYPKYAAFENRNSKPEHFYEAETDQGYFTLLKRQAVRRGRTLKYKQWVLWVNGRPVTGSRHYRLRDAKDFAEKHLAQLQSYAERRNKFAK